MAPCPAAVVGLPPGGPCAGHGSCAVVPGCVCDDGWSGAADFYSLDGFSCQNPVGLDRAMWGLCALAWVRIFVDAVVILRDTERVGRHTGGHRMIRLQALVCIPLMILAFAFRAITGRPIGVDLASSLLYSIAMSVQCFLTWVGQMELFSALVRGTAEIGSSQQADALVARTFRLGLVINVVYCGGILFGLSLWGCFMDAGPTPERIALILLRNLGSLAYFCMFIVVDFVQNKSIEKLIKQASGNDKPNTKLMDTMLKLQSNFNRSLKVIGFIFLPLTLIFSAVPPLFSYSYIYICVLITLSAGKSHLIYAYKPVALSNTKSRVLSPATSSPQLRVPDSDATAGGLGSFSATHTSVGVRTDSFRLNAIAAPPPRPPQ